MSASPAVVPAIEITDLNVRAGKTPLLSGISIAIEQGEWVTIIGPNGAGKSTLLRAMAGLTHRSSGLKQSAEAVTVCGDSLDSLSNKALARRVAWVPQTPVIPEGITIADYVLLGRTPHLALLATERKADLELAGEILADLDLEHLAGRKVETLSGGERQRAVVGRALAQEADIILLDEPTSALDLGHQQELLVLLERLRQEQGRTVVSTMHDLTLAGQSADRLVLVADGEIVADGTASDVLTAEHLERIYGASISIVEHDGAIVVIPSPLDVRK